MTDSIAYPDGLSEHNSTSIPHDMLWDDRLTWTAKGIMAYALSKGRRGCITPSSIAGEGRITWGDMEDAMRELVEFGYLVVNSDGHWVLQ